MHLPIVCFRAFVVCVNEISRFNWKSWQLAHKFLKITLCLLGIYILITPFGGPHWPLVNFQLSWWIFNCNWNNTKYQIRCNLVSKLKLSLGSQSKKFYPRTVSTNSPKEDWPRMDCFVYKDPILFKSSNVILLGFLKH